MAWEKPAKGTMRSKDPTLYGRGPPNTQASIKRMLQDTSVEVGELFERYAANQGKKKKIVKMYDIEDIQNELMELSDSDETDMDDKAQDQIDKFKIKKKVRYYFKTHFVAPDSELDYFKYGRVLGKGAYGKVNVCMQKLSSKLCAVKSINLNKVTAESAIKRIANEKDILEKIRHPNIVKLYETIRDAR